MERLSAEEIGDDALTVDEAPNRARAIPRATRHIDRRSVGPRPRFRLAGPLKGDYSLAVVNRHFALALQAADCDVELISQEDDLGDDAHFLATGLQSQLVSATSEPARNTLLSVNDWPIRVPAPGQRAFVHCFAWEESILPFDMAVRLSRNTLVATTAEFVTRACINSGVTSRVVTIGNGTDHILRPAADRPLRNTREARPFRFVHISSCFPRKGIDVLLAAYFAEFSGDDNVELLIKTFDNPHNRELRAALERLRSAHANPPRVLLNISSLQPAAYYALYAQADCLVAPSHGEGFLLPAAEAMLNNVPVITTGWGGQCDFCTEDTSWLIDFKLEPSTSHVAAAGGLWARPNEAHLRSRMRAMTRLSVEERAQRLHRAQRLLERQFTWKAAAQRFIAAVQTEDTSVTLSEASSTRRHVIISTFDQRCGIATFTRELMRAAPERHRFAGVVTEQVDRRGIQTTQLDRSVPVLPVWQRHTRFVPDIVEATRRLRPDNVLIQHHPGLYSWDMLAGIVNGLADTTRITLQLHAATEGWHELCGAATRLKHATRFIVHNAPDYMTIAGLFGAERTALLPHGIDAPRTSRPRLPVAPWRFASFGFAAPHKGFHKGIEALAILRQAGIDANYEIISALDPANDQGRHYLKYCAELAVRLGVADWVTIDPRFLPLEEVMKRLSRCVAGLLLYDDVNEGASGASRVMLRSGVPVLVSSSPIFADLHALCRAAGGSALSLAREMKLLIEQPQQRAAQLARQMEFVRATRWEQVAMMVFDHAG